MNPMVLAIAMKNKRAKIAKICLLVVFSSKDCLIGVALKKVFIIDFNLDFVFFLKK